MIRLALLATVAAGCLSTTPPEDTGLAGGGSVENSALVGSWYAGAGGTSVPYDPTTGAYGMPNGQGLIYTLRADGTYTKAFQSYYSSAGCTSGFTAFENGTYVDDASSLRTHPTGGTVSYRDTCAPSLDSDKPNTDLGGEAFSVQLAGDQLTLVRSDGKSGTFRRL